MSTPDLLTHDDNTILRPATRDEWIASVTAAAEGDWSGVIEVDGRDCWVDGDTWTGDDGEPELWTREGAATQLRSEGHDRDDVETVVAELADEIGAVWTAADLGTARTRTR